MQAGPFDAALQLRISIVRPGAWRCCCSLEHFPTNLVCRDGADLAQRKAQGQKR